MLSADEVLLDGLRGFKTGGGEVRHVGVAVGHADGEHEIVFFAADVQQSAAAIRQLRFLVRLHANQTDEHGVLEQLAELPREVIPEALRKDGGQRLPGDGGILIEGAQHQHLIARLGEGHAQRFRLYIIGSERVEFALEQRKQQRILQRLPVGGGHQLTAHVVVLLGEGGNRILQRLQIIRIRPPQRFGQLLYRAVIHLHRIVDDQRARRQHHQQEQRQHRLCAVERRKRLARGEEEVVRPVQDGGRLAVDEVIRAVQADGADAVGQRRIQCHRRYDDLPAAVQYRTLLAGGALRREEGQEVPLLHEENQDAVLQARKDRRRVDERQIAFRAAAPLCRADDAAAAVGKAARHGVAFREGEDAVEEQRGGVHGSGGVHHLGVRVRQRNFGNQGGGGKQILELVHQPQVAHGAGRF